MDNKRGMRTTSKKQAQYQRITQVMRTGDHDDPDASPDLSGPDSTASSNLADPL